MPEVLTEPDLPEDWGLIKEICSDGQHRYLPDAPRCGCGSTINRSVERSRLERVVIEAAKEWNNTNYRDTLKCEEQLAALGDAVDALNAFESSR